MGESTRQRALSLGLVVISISAIITQLVLIREFLNIFSGNELVLGILLFNWLLLTGTGAYLGRHLAQVKDRVQFWLVCQTAIALLPLLQVAAIRSIRSVLFLPGEMLSLTATLAGSFLVLLPFCLISGALLTLACVMLSRKKEGRKGDSIGKVYFIDSVGSVIGGLTFTFILIYFLNSVQIACIVLFINLAAVVLLSRFFRKAGFTALGCTLIIIAALLISIYDINSITTRLQYSGQEILFNKDTPYGRVLITRTGEQVNFLENGLTLFSTADVISNEETVHYTMLQHSRPQKILLISGGIAGTIDEILKYDVQNIDYIELDPEVISAAGEHAGYEEHPLVTTHNIDARLFVKQTDKKYDVVIIDLPDPSTAQLNRFYTIEFFTELRQVLNENGVIGLAISGSDVYMSPELKELNSVMHSTLVQVFKNVIVIPSSSNHFIASDAELSYFISGLVEERGIETQFVNSHYLKSIITMERITYLFNSLSEDVQPNTDFRPVMYHHTLQHWLSRFDATILALLLIPVAIALIYFALLRPIPLALFTTGFTTTGLEMVLLLGFQMLYGYVYSRIGLIIALFMLGLAIGSYYMNRASKGMLFFFGVLGCVAGYSLVLPLILLGLSRASLGSSAVQTIFSLLTFAIAFLDGMLFPLASRLSFKSVPKTSAQLFNADFVGASLGALVVSTVLIPLFGIATVCLILAGSIIISTGILYLRRGLL